MMGMAKFDKNEKKMKKEIDGLGDYMPVPEEPEPDPGHEDWTDEQVEAMEEAETPKMV